MAQLALGLVGAYVGSFVGMPQLGFAIGSALGGALFTPTQKSQGPHLADLKAAQVAYGSCIPYIEGEPRLGGNIVWASQKRELKNTESVGAKGGGGAEQTTYTYEQDVMYMLSENVCWHALHRVWLNGQLVGDSSEMWDELTFYPGTPDQLPDPTYEAAVGVGNAPAYRGRATIVIRGLKEGVSGQLPNLTFQGGPRPYVLRVLTDGVEAHRWYYDAFNFYVVVKQPDTATAFLDADKVDGISGDHYQGVQSNSLFTLHKLNLTSAGLALGPAIPNSTLDAHYVADPYMFFGRVYSTGPYAEDPAAGLARELAHADAGAYGGPYDLLLGIPTPFVTPSVVGGLVPISPLGAPVSVGADPVSAYRSLDAPSWTGTDAMLPPALTFELDVIDDVLRLPSLKEVVLRQCVRAGLALNQVDAYALASIDVDAMPLTQLTSPRQVLEMLMAAYMFTAVEGDVLRFRLRGGAPVATIPYDDLVASDNDPLPITKANDLELPVQVFVKYSNTLDDYQDGNESSDRLVSTGQNTAQVELVLGLTPPEAKHIADVHVLDAVASALRIGPFGLTRAYAALEPSDVVNMADADGNTIRVRLTKKTEVAGQLTFEGVSDDASVFDGTGITSTAGYTNSTTLRAPVDTALALLDMPILRDTDDDPGLYAAVKPTTDVPFPGAMLFKSADDVSFDSAATLLSASVFGVASTVLADGPRGVFDEVNTLTVSVPYGQLASVTRDVLLNASTNAMLVGSEVIQFRSAELISANTYKLSGLLRGLKGTEWAMAGHGADERVVLLGSALRRVSLGTGELGINRYWKAVTLGRTGSSASSQAFIDQGVSKKPYAPVDLRFARDGSSNITVTLQRRTRVATRLIGPLGISCPLGESFEQYSVDVYTDGTYTTVARTIAASSPAIAYSAADQAADFGSAQSLIHLKAYQLSAAVGRGYAATAQG